MRRALAVAACLALAACSGGNGGSGKGDALVVVSAPLTAEPWVGQFLERGAELAAEQVAKEKGRHIRVEVLDNAGSAQTNVANARRAVQEKAIAFITDGVGADAVAAVSDPARMPVFVAFDGSASFIDATKHPTLFRMAPANEAMCRRLADYLADTEPGRRFAVLADDSAYGREGAANVKADLLHDRVSVVSDQTVPAGAADVSAYALRARRTKAQVLVVWAKAPTVASVLRAVRSTGWDVKVVTGPSGEDPLVRQRLADHPEWVDGLVFVSFRITSEVGGAPFAAYRRDYEKQYGADKVGVRAGGRDVLMPPDWSMYSYDTVHLMKAALDRAGTTDRAQLFDALLHVTITGANGDERGFGPDDREGVSPDDMYFATFRDMRFHPNRDDKLSTNLPEVPQ
jgi:ABC-type branched-subunit amino acid transport system substrate-binding protein